jgi:hypothetical protein
MIKIGELFRSFRVSPEMVEELTTHPGLDITKLLNYFQSTYAGNGTVPYISANTFIFDPVSLALI